MDSGIPNDASRGDLQACTFKNETLYISICSPVQRVSTDQGLRCLLFELAPPVPIVLTAPAYMLHVC